MSKRQARRQRSRERTAEEAAASAAAENTPPAGAPNKVEKFFLSQKGEKLPWLDDADFKRVQKACYHFQYGKCDLTPEECLSKDGKVHDKLPKKLLDYAREPGSKRRGRSGSPSQAGRTGKDPTKRWATKYCWQFADGKCQKTEAECGRGPHISEEEAKKRADGKTMGDKGYDPHGKGPKKDPSSFPCPCAVPIMVLGRTDGVADPDGPLIARVGRNPSSVTQQGQEPAAANQSSPKE